MRLPITALLATLGMSAAAVEVHVAPTGADSNVGTAAAPLATLQAARDALRASGALGSEPCTVILHDGTHRLSEALRLSVADSGSAEHPVVWRAADGATPTISGALTLNLTWEAVGDGSYRAKVASDQAIDQLFVNGSRQVLARYPDLGAGLVGELKGKPAGHTPYDGAAANANGSDGKAAEWADPTGAFVHAMHGGLWGSAHFRVEGKDDKGELILTGGYQNNRSKGVRSTHPGYWMIENVREELDAPAEWFHAVDEQTLYYYPAEGVDLNGEVLVEAVFQIPHLIECYGDFTTDSFELPEGTGNSQVGATITTWHTTAPVKHLRFEGLAVTGTTRTFMGTFEPLLRSDWSIYRGGAIHLRGTEDVAISKCTFRELGGNAVFVDGYNRDTAIRTSYFINNGASDVNFVGSPSAVRNPAFGYSQDRPDPKTVDREIGPKTKEHPADGIVEDCLMTRCGRFEKQVAGVNISMSSRITVTHCTIHHTPRAGINICDGTWGGHQLTWNDVFETVLETHDHGAFNSWGRDRFWHRAAPSGPRVIDKASGKSMMELWLAETGHDAVTWDAYQTTLIANNRWHCEHGWDVDLDDGSTNYHIHHNLCLSGGLKTREGYQRIIHDNVLLGKGFTCNVPYPKPGGDKFTANILWGGGYDASKPELWGGVRDYTLFHNPSIVPPEPATAIQKKTNDDANSLIGDAKFLDAAGCDFRVADDSPALKLGYDNQFPIEGWGVTSAHLQALAPKITPSLPRVFFDNERGGRTERVYRMFGALGHQMSTEAELTGTGMFDIAGILLDEVPADSAFAAFGFEVDDVILNISGIKTKKYISSKEFRDLNIRLESDVEYTATIWRDQREQKITFTVPKR
ncbi:MAG: right-handed parallel beta-helix repeat-containing protein [Planctomycetota bacterium]|jgi:hypothetical protein